MGIMLYLVVMVMVVRLPVRFSRRPCSTGLRWRCGQRRTGSGMRAGSPGTPAWPKPTRASLGKRQKGKKKKKKRHTPQDAIVLFLFRCFIFNQFTNLYNFIAFVRCDGEVPEVVSCVDHALARIDSALGENGGSGAAVDVLVTGSLHLVGTFLAALEESWAE